MSMKISSYQYRNSHYKNKTVSRPSHLYNGNHYYWKTIFILRRGPGETNPSNSKMFYISMAVDVPRSIYFCRMADRYIWPHANELLLLLKIFFFILCIIFVIDPQYHDPSEPRFKTGVYMKDIVHFSIRMHKWHALCTKHVTHVCV